MDVDEIRYVLALALRSIRKAWHGEMHVFCRTVLGLFSHTTDLSVSFTFSCILCHCLLHRSQVELSGLITLTDLDTRLVRINLICDLLDDLLIVSPLRCLVCKCHLNIDVFEIRHEVCLLRWLQDVLINVVNLVNLGMLCFTGHVGLFIGVLGGCRGTLNVFFINFGHLDGIVIYWLETWLRRVVLHSCHIEQLLPLQVSRVPLLAGESEVVVFLAESTRVSTYSRVFFGSTTPTYISPVDLLICLLAFVNTRISQILAPIFRNVFN